ncbi:MAG: tetratricopeptide repeat protein [Pyrinomonadaceae bacterium]
MKRCPECRRDYYDDTLLYCLDDGNALLEGPASVDEPATAILSEPPAVAGGLTQPTAILGEPATAIFPRTEAEPQVKLGNSTKRQSLSAHRAAKPLAALIAVVLILAGGFFAYRYFSPAKQIESIAVMPFVNESGNADVEYLSDGMTETLINSLSQIPNLSVKARSSVFRYKGKETHPQTIGRELNVQAILNGRVIQRGEQLTLGLELIDAKTENVIWSESYNRKQTDLVALQSEIARDVSGKLKSKLSGADEAKVTKTYTANPEAYQLYLKGNFYTSKYTKEGLAKGIEYYNQAIAIDVNYALAYNGLAYNYIVADDWFLSPNDSMPKARDAARRALEIDATLADAHTSLAVVLHWYDWDWAGAEKEFQRAIELNPNDPRTRQYYAWFLSEQVGRAEEAIAEGKKAQQLDPLSPEVNTFLGIVLSFARRSDQAVEQLRKTIELDPNYWLARTCLGRAYEQKGDINQAIAEYQRARQVEENVPEPLALLGRAYALSGKKAEAEKAIDELKELSKRTYVPPYNFAIVYAGLGNKDEAFAYLNRAYDDRSYYLAWLKVDSQLDSLRDDPRFKDLLKRMNLPE